MGQLSFDELKDDFNNLFYVGSWWQTDLHKRALTQIEFILREPGIHQQSQKLLDLLCHHQKNLKDLKDKSSVYQVILKVLTIWILNSKPDAEKLQTIINCIVNSSISDRMYESDPESTLDPQTLQLIKDLVLVGGQIAYYAVEVKPHSAGDLDLAQTALLTRKEALNQFLTFWKKTLVSLNPLIQPGVKEVCDLLEKNASQEIDSSNENKGVGSLLPKSLFRHFFSSTTYNAQEFESYQALIKKWLANGVKKDDADEVLLGHLLQVGIEQVSTERESAGFGKGYKTFSTQAQNFIKFLTAIHQQYKLPNTLKLQALKEEIGIRQAQLLEDGSGMVKLLENFLEILSYSTDLGILRYYTIHCNTVPNKREALFFRRLLEVGVAKCSFFKNSKMTRESLAEISRYGANLSEELNIVKINFSVNFLLMLVERYRKEEIKAFMIRKDFASIWGFCEGIGHIFSRTKNDDYYLRILKPSKDEGYLDILVTEEERIRLFYPYYYPNHANLIKGLRETTKETLKDCLASFTSIDDYVKYLNTIQAFGDNFLTDENDIDSSAARKFFALNSQQLAGLLKTPEDYRKILNVLVVERLNQKLSSASYTREDCIINSTFFVDQVKVLMQVNRKITLEILDELKANHNLENSWKAIETHVLVPDRAPHSALFALLLKITSRSEKEAKPLATALKTEPFGAIDTFLSGQSTASALTTAYIQLLQNFYSSLNVATSADKSVQKRFVANILIVFMTLQKPSAKHFKAVINTLYTLKKTYQLSHASVNYQFITDILIIRAQSLDTVQEVKAYSDLLTEIQKKYPFPEGSIEQKLKAAVENKLLNSEAKQPIIADFNPKALFNHLEHFRYLQLFEGLSALRQRYQFSLEKSDKRLLEQLLAKGIWVSPHSWEFHDCFHTFLRFCAACQEDAALLHSAFAIFEKGLKSYEPLENLGCSRIKMLKPGDQPSPNDKDSIFLLPNKTGGGFGAYWYEGSQLTYYRINNTNANFLLVIFYLCKSTSIGRDNTKFSLVASYCGYTQNLKNRPLYREFLSYVMNRDVNRVFELFKGPGNKPMSVEEKIRAIDRIYKFLNAQGMLELMRSDFLKLCFAECKNSKDYSNLAEFLLFRIPYEDTAAPEILKRLSEKLAVYEYNETYVFINGNFQKQGYRPELAFSTFWSDFIFSLDKKQPTGKLEDFLFTTLEIAASKATNPAERVEFFDFIKRLNEKFTFSSPDKQRAFIDVVKKIAAHQLQENLLAMEGMGKTLEALNLPEDMRSTMDRLNAYNTAAYVDLAGKMVEYDTDLADAQQTYVQQIQLIKNKEASQTDHEMTLTHFDALTKDSEEARSTVEKTLQDTKAAYQTLINEVNIAADAVKNQLNSDYIAAEQRFKTFLSAKTARETTESEKRSDLEKQRTETYRSMEAIRDRDVPQSGLIKKHIQQQFDQLDEALKQKTQGLDTHQQTIERLIADINALKTQPNLEFKTLSAKLVELNSKIKSAEEAVEESPTAFETAKNALNQATAWIAEVKEQETLQQESVKKIQAECQALLSNAHAEFDKHLAEFSGYRKQNTKFSFHPLSSLDKASFEPFFSSEKQLIAVLLPIEGSLADWGNHLNTTRHAFDIERQKMADALVDPKLSLVERDDRVKQFGAEKDRLDQAMKAFASHIVEIETRLNGAKDELALQTTRVINAFDHQMGLREVRAEGLAKDIAAQLAEEKSLRDAVKDDGEKDAWLTKALASVADTEATNEVVLGDLARRTHAVGEIIQDAKAVQDVEKQRFFMRLNAVKKMANTVLPRIATYRERLETVWRANYISWVLADLLLAVFDHGVLSYLPFVKPLKTFSANQKTLADYTQYLIQIEAQCERVQTLKDPLAAETQQQIQNLHNELLDRQGYLEGQMPLFLATVSQDIVQDKVETQKLSSTPSNHALQHEPIKNWLLSETNHVITSIQTFKNRLSDAHTGYAHYQEAGINLKEGLKEHHRLNQLSEEIEMVRENKVKTEQALAKLKTELTVLSADRQRFTNQTEADYYQEKLKHYRQSAEQSVFVLHMILEDAELSREKKLRFVADLLQSHPGCVDQRDDAQKTPLYIAVKQGDFEMVALLLQKGAKVNVLDASGLSPLALALTANQQAIVACLKQHGAQPHFIDIQALLDENIKTNNIAAVKLCCAERDWLGINLNQTVKNALLHLAAKAGDIHFLEQLIDVGADIQSRDEQNHTLLLSMVTGFAMISDEKEKTRALAFIAKLKSDTKDKQEGNNILHIAILGGDNELVKKLFDQRSYLYKSTYLTEGNLAGDSALHLLCQKGDMELFKYLITNTPYIHQASLFKVQNQEGETLLHAAMNDPVNLYLLEYLIERDNSLIDQQNKAGEKPFETEVGQRTFARIRNAKDIYSTLYQRLVDKKVEQNYQRQLEAASTRLKRPRALPEVTAENTPQHSPIPTDILKLYQGGKRRTRVLDEIENENFPLSKKDSDQNTLLHLAVEKNDLDMLQMIKAQAGRAEQAAKWLELLELPNGQGDSPLHLAIKLGHVELVRGFLTDRGDFLLRQDGQGNAIWQIAFDLKSAQMLAVMLNTGLPPLRAFMKEILNNIDFNKNIAETDFWFKVIETHLCAKSALLHLLALTDKYQQSLGHALLARAMKNKDTALIHKLFAQHQYNEKMIHALVGTYDLSDKAFKAFWIDTIEATPKDKRHWLINAQDRHGNTLLHNAVKDLSLEESDQNDLPNVEISGSVGWCLRNGAVQDTEFEVGALTLFCTEMNQVFKCDTKEKLESFVKTLCAKFNLPEDKKTKVLAAFQRCLTNNTPSRGDQSAVLGILIEACGFDMTVKNAAGKSVLALAREGWEESTRALLFTNNAKRIIYVTLIQRILKVLGSTKTLQNEIQEQAQKEQKKPTSFKAEAGDTSLHRLVKLNWLNEKNWKEPLWGNVSDMLDVPNENGRTPLHIAVLKGDVEQVKFLLAKQAALNKPTMMDMKDCAGQTVLHLLAKGTVKGDDQSILAITQLLLAQGADVNVADEKGQTPLHHLAERQDALGFALFKQVLAHGANVNAVNQDSETVLHQLAQRKDDSALAMARLIKETGKAKNNIQSMHGWTAPGIAWEVKNAAFLALFPLSAKEALNAKMAELKGVVKGVFSPSTNASEKTDVVPKNPSPKTSPSLPRKTSLEPSLDTPLGKLHALAETRKNMTTTTVEGDTLLHLAVKEANLPYIKGIQALDKLLPMTNDAGLTPLDIAIQAKNFDIARYLVSQGAEMSNQGFRNLSTAEQDKIMGYPEMQSDLLTAVENSDSDRVVTFFDDLNRQRSTAKDADTKAIIESQIKRLVHAKDQKGQTLLQQLVAREKARQSKLLTEDLTLKEKKARQADKQIVGVLLRYTSAEKPESLGIYDLLDSPYGYQTQKPQTLEKVARKIVQQAQKLTTFTSDTLLQVYQHHKDIFDAEDEQDMKVRGIDAVQKMHAWIENLDRNDDREKAVKAVDKAGNSLLHLAAEDNMKVVVQWLLPKTVTQKIGTLLHKIKSMGKKIGKVAKKKAIRFAAKKTTNRMGGSVASTAVGVSVTAATAVFLGPFSIPLGILAKKATSSAISAVSKKGGKGFAEGLLSGEEEKKLPQAPVWMDVNTKNNAGDTPLHIAARDPEKLWMVMAFLEASADIQQKNNAGDTPLHVAVRAGNTDVVVLLANLAFKDPKKLFNVKNLINDQNAAGETPLHIAIQKGDQNLVNLLSEKGADWTLKTALQQTPADLLKLKLEFIAQAIANLTPDAPESARKNLHAQKSVYETIQKKYLEPRKETADTPGHYLPLFKDQKLPEPMSSVVKERRAVREKAKEKESDIPKSQAPQGSTKKT